ncbi:hypothetical protein D3C87_460240 [compost metagenome]
MKTLTIAIFSLMLAGCICTPSKPEIITQVVKVPVPVKCEVAQIEAPVRYFDQAKKENTLFDNTKYLAAENEVLWGYSNQLKAALEGCTK